MRTFVLAFSVVLTVLCLVVMTRPKATTDFLLDSLATVWMNLLAATIRIGMGWVMLQSVPISRFPRTFEVLGWLFIVAGIVILLIPPSRVQALARDAYERFEGWTPLGGIAGILLAAFLAWSVW